MNRRALLQALPAVAVLPAMAAVPALASETEIVALYRQWASLYERINSLVAGDVTDEMFNDIVGIEKAIFDAQPQTSADALAKLVVYSHGYIEDLHVDQLFGGFRAEARALVEGRA